MSTSPPVSHNYVRKKGGKRVEFAVQKHVDYIFSVEKRKDNFESVVMEHLRINGAYWGLATLDLLRKIDTMDTNAVVPWIMACQHESGGFGCNIGHDPHVLYTLCAVQCLALLDKIHLLDIEKVLVYFHMLSGTVAVIGQILCCVGALAITGHLDRVDKDLLEWWLCERQVKSRGLNGRPGKLPDVSVIIDLYLTMIDRVNWIDKEKLIEFILHCQDTEKGGISDRPDDAVGIYHTYFGVAGLSLLEYPGIKAIDPAHALPTDVVNRIFFGR